MKNNFFKCWIPLYIYAGVIFYLSSIPKPLPDIDIPFLDKILHVCEYSVFGVLASRAFRNSPRSIFFKNFKILATLFAVLYGISDEFHQGFVSERQFNVFDMLADGIGGTLGAFIYGRYYPL
ncbi:VanZ family protein [Candidatus Omnitrophota bacterium]